jgi:hypothetical protein
MRIHRRTTLSLDDLAAWLNPIVVGWMNYYGRFYLSVDEFPSDPCQYLPEAVGGEEVSAFAIPQQFPTVVDGSARSTAPSVRPLAMGSLLLDARLMRRAR